MQTNISLDPAGKVYVIPSGGGYSCFGFDNTATHHLQMLLQLVYLDQPPRPADAEPQDLMSLAQKHPLAWNDAQDYGQISGYEKYQQVLALWCKSAAAKQTYFAPGTALKVRDILESARKTGRELRLFIGDTETGRDWMGEHDRVGRIGRSMGPMKVPLLIGKDEFGGGAILTDCIVRIIDADTLSELYRHPKYQEPNLTVSPEDYSPGGYKFRVDRDGELQARFKKIGSAHSFVAFMLGHAVKVNTRH